MYLLKIVYIRINPLYIPENVTFIVCSDVDILTFENANLLRMIHSPKKMGLKKSQLFYGQNFETPAKVRNAEIFEKMSKNGMQFVKIPKVRKKANNNPYVS